MTIDTRPVVGLMLGDVTGIGAEIAAKMLATQDVKKLARTVLVGDARHLALGCREAATEVAFHGVSSVEAIDWSRGGFPLLDLGNLDPAKFPRAQVSPEAGRVAGETLKAMTELALDGKLDAVCFAPLNKAALHRGGWNYHDEHQMFADWTQHRGYYSEMNVIPEFSTFRVTSHVSLRKALELITPERVEQAIGLAHRTMRSTGIAAPRIGVAALNPHAGENGLFGDEEVRIIRPSVERVRAGGIDCTGPLPSDTIFLRARAGEFDAVVIMYHDQGQIATKLLGFQNGVTVSAGMKAVYATPAHGTAFDIVGTGRANPGAMTAAFRMAAKLGATRRNA
jgi:4-phospho-D-threonate 3-dehydrogenase / 4-phospho-D-erythronate 3-dehydrogenase